MQHIPPYYRDQAQPQYPPPGMGMAPRPPPYMMQQPPQQQQQQPSAVVPNIRYVWKDNLESEFRLLRELVETYNYVTVLLEFAGVTGRPIGQFLLALDFHYQTVRVNADLMLLVQLGITLSDANGNRPGGALVLWQFNFHYDLDDEMFASDAMDTLLKTGLNPMKHAADGVDPVLFALMLIESGMVLLSNVHWVLFHAGMDLGFLVLMLTNNMLPEDAEGWGEWCRLYFPNVYDLKYMYSVREGQPGEGGKLSVEALADELGIPRLNHMYQVGNQCHLAALCFTEMGGARADARSGKGVIYGITA